MGTDHGKNKVRIPLRKPKITQSAKTTVSDEQKRRQAGGSSKKTTMTDKQKRKQTGGSSKKTTVTDTQKRGQVSPRYNLFEGRRLPKTPTKKSRKNSMPSTTPSKNYIIKPLYILPKGGKTKKNKIVEA